MLTYVADPLSRHDLRQYAKQIRTATGVGQLFFPVDRFLESIHLSVDDDEFAFVIVEDHELPANIHAQYDMNNNCISIKQSVYDSACSPDSSTYGRDRFTILHEISHYLLLKISGIKFHRSFGEDVPRYCDPEWQADCLAGELLIPADLTQGMSSVKIVEACGVSFAAANYQLKQNKK